MGPEGREKAELHLLEQAADFGPRKLKLLARHLVDVIDPDAAEARLAAALEAEERKAARSCFLQIFADEHGVTHLRGAIPTLAGDQLLTALNAFASPRRPDPYNREDATGKKVANADLLGQAFVELISRYPVGQPATDRRHQRHDPGHHEHPDPPRRPRIGRPAHRPPALTRRSPPPGV